MGLIAAALSSASSTLADQYKEYFYCDSIPADVLAVRGKKKASSKSKNKGSDNVITNGSTIAIADGQCMLIVDQGYVVDLCAQPGEYVYDMSSEPSLLDGGKLGDNIKKVFQTLGKRITYGGEIAKDQRVYFFNIKEIIGNKYGTPSPVPFRVVDQRAGIDIDISVRCFGEYSYRITNPMTFYANLCGNMQSEYKRSEIDSQLKSELLTHLQPAFSKISDLGIRYSAVPGHTTELAQILRDELTAEWKEARGIEIQKVGVSSIKATEDDEKMLKEMQKTAAYTNANLAGAYMTNATGQAMQTAAANTAGAMTGFMGMNMASQVGGANIQGLYQMGQQQAAQQQAAGAWTCSCGAQATGKFCPECGAKKPEPKMQAGGWTCPSCGTKATGKFCPECGTKKPAEKADGWTCSCGAVNKGKFCAECGAKKPAAAPLYRCDKCGWEPEDPTNPPKFCPECGDLFDENDIQK